MKEPLSRQEQYLSRQHKNKRRIFCMRILIFIAFFALWEIAADLGWIDDFIFSSPSRMFRCMFSMAADGSLAGSSATQTICISFLLVIGFTLLITILLWISPSVSKTVEPYLVVLNSLPKSALAPLLIVWLGGNYKTIIVTGMSVAIFGSVLSLYTDFMEVSSEKLKLIETLGGTRKDILCKILIPANIPSLLSIMKVDIGLCLVGVIIGEFIASRKGLGFLIIYGSQVFKLDWVLMSIIILCLIAIGLYVLIHGVEKWYVKRL